MDWILSVTTLLANSNLGWSKGSTLAWILHILNALFWIIYALLIKQYGLILLSLATIVVDIGSILKGLGK